MAQGSLPDGVVQLDELEILVVVDNETDTLSSVDDGVPQIPEIAHLASGPRIIPWSPAFSKAWAPGHIRLPCRTFLPSPSKG